MADAKKGANMLTCVTNKVQVQYHGSLSCSMFCFC